MDAAAPGPEYYKKIIPNTATAFFSPELQQKYPELCVLDMRPRTMDRLMQLEYGLQVWPVLEEYGANAQCFRFERSERDGLPIYTIVENCETNFYRIFGGNYIQQFQQNILPGEQQFYNDAVHHIQNMMSPSGRRFMLYAGSLHAYELWHDGQIDNVYLAIDSATLEKIAKTTAYIDWVEDLQF